MIPMVADSNPMQSHLLTSAFGRRAEFYVLPCRLTSTRSCSR